MTTAAERRQQVLERAWDRRRRLAAERDQQPLRRALFLGGAIGLAVGVVLGQLLWVKDLAGPSIAAVIGCAIGAGVGAAMILERAHAAERARARAEARERDGGTGPPSRGGAPRAPCPQGGQGPAAARRPRASCAARFRAGRGRPRAARRRLPRPARVLPRPGRRSARPLVGRAEVDREARRLTGAASAAAASRAPGGHRCGARDVATPCLTARRARPGRSARRHDRGRGAVARTVCRARSRAPRAASARCTARSTPTRSGSTASRAGSTTCSSAWPASRPASTTSAGSCASSRPSCARRARTWPSCAPSWSRTSRRCGPSSSQTTSRRLLTPSG